MKVVIGIIVFGIISIPFLWIYLLISNIVYNTKKYNKKKKEKQREEEIRLEKIKEKIDREFYEGMLESIYELLSLGIELDADATADYEEATKWLSEHPDKRR